MSRKIQIRRGTTVNRLAITPSVGEFVWDKTEKRIYVGDGGTVGGVLAAPNRFYVHCHFSGDAVDESIFGFFYAEFPTVIYGMLLFAQDAPTGADLTVDLVNGAGAEQTKIGTLAAAASRQRTLFGAPLSLAAGDILQAKIKSVGSGTPGQNLTVLLICS